MNENEPGCLFHYLKINTCRDRSTCYFFRLLLAMSSTSSPCNVCIQCSLCTPVPGEAHMLAQLLGPTSSYWVLLAGGVTAQARNTSRLGPNSSRAPGTHAWAWPSAGPAASGLHGQGAAGRFWRRKESLVRSTSVICFVPKKQKKTKKPSVIYFYHLQYKISFFISLNFHQNRLRWEFF